MAGNRSLTWLGVCLVLFITGTLVQDFAAARAGAALIGPLHGAVLSIVPLVVVFLVGSKGTGVRSRWRVAAWSIVMLAGLVFFYGTGLYWAATRQGVAIHRGLFATTRSLGWSDVTVRGLSCTAGRHGSASAHFGIGFRDGTSISVDTSGDDAGRAQFEALAEWTSGHRVSARIGDGSRCPDFVVGFLEELNR